MDIWWSTLSLLEQIFFIIALPSTLIILIQTVMLIFGGGFGDAGGAGADVSGLGGASISELSDAEITPDGVHDGHLGIADADGLRLFSIRGIMSFLTVFGWSGVVLLATSIPIPVAIVISFVLGAAALYLMAILVRALMKLQESGTMNHRSVIGKTGSVYLAIPPVGEGHGKINVMLGDALREFNAVSKDSEAIPTGVSVRVLSVSGDMFTVEREV